MIREPLETRTHGGYDGPSPAEMEAARAEQIAQRLDIPAPSDPPELPVHLKLRRVEIISPKPGDTRYQLLGLVAVAGAPNIGGRVLTADALQSIVAQHRALRAKLPVYGAWADDPENTGGTLGFPDKIALVVTNLFIDANAEPAQLWAHALVYDTAAGQRIQKAIDVAKARGVGYLDLALVLMGRLPRLDNGRDAIDGDDFQLVRLDIADLYKLRDAELVRSQEPAAPRSAMELELAYYHGIGKPPTRAEWAAANGREAFTPPTAEASVPEPLTLDRDLRDRRIHVLPKRSPLGLYRLTGLVKDLGNDPFARDAAEGAISLWAKEASRNLGRWYMDPDTAPTLPASGDAAFEVENLWIDGNNLWARACVNDTPAGRIFQRALENQYLRGTDPFVDLGFFLAGLALDPAWKVTDYTHAHVGIHDLDVVQARRAQQPAEGGPLPTPARHAETAQREYDREVQRVEGIVAPDSLSRPADELKVTSSRAAADYLALLGLPSVQAEEQQVAARRDVRVLEHVVRYSKEWDYPRLLAAMETAEEALGKGFLDVAPPPIAAVLSAMLVNKARQNDFAFDPSTPATRRELEICLLRRVLDGHPMWDLCTVSLTETNWRPSGVTWEEGADPLAGVVYPKELRRIGANGAIESFGPYIGRVAQELRRELLNDLKRAIIGGSGRTLDSTREPLALHSRLVEAWTLIQAALDAKGPPETGDDAPEPVLLMAPAVARDLFGWTEALTGPFEGGLQSFVRVPLLNRKCLSFRGFVDPNYPTNGVTVGWINKGRSCFHAEMQEGFWFRQDRATHTPLRYINTDIRFTVDRGETVWILLAH